MNILAFSITDQSSNESTIVSVGQLLQSGKLFFSQRSGTIEHVKSNSKKNAHLCNTPKTSLTSLDE